MSRTLLELVAQDRRGDVVPEALVAVANRGGGSPTLYASEVGAATLSNPLRTNGEGLAACWLDRGRYEYTISRGSWSSGPHAWDSSPAHGIGLGDLDFDPETEEEITAAVTTLNESIDRKEERLGFNVRSYGAELDGVTDDTDALLAAIADAEAAATSGFGAAVLVPHGTLGLSDEAAFEQAQVDFICFGSTIKALSSDATLRFGPDAPGIPIFVNQVKGFYFDGDGVADTPIRLNVNYASVEDVSVVSMAGDGIHVLGQNSSFKNVKAAGCGGHGIVLDNGCGTNDFLGGASWGNDGANLVFQQSVAYMSPLFEVPTVNTFYGFLVEGIGNADTELAAVLHTAGAFNRLVDPQVVRQHKGGGHDDRPGIHMKRIDGQSNGRLYIEGGVFTGPGPSDGAAAIEIDSQADPVDYLDADYAVVLEGDICFSGWAADIRQKSGTPVLDRSSRGHSDGGLLAGGGNGHTHYGAGVWYEAVGAGAPPYATVKDPYDQTVTNDQYIGGDLIQTGSLGGLHSQAEIATPGSPGANHTFEYTDDDGSGNTRKMLKFPSGVAQVLGTDLGDASLGRDYYLGRNLLMAAGFLSRAEIATPSSPSADFSRTFTRDDGSGATEDAIKYSNGKVRRLSRATLADQIDELAAWRLMRRAMAGIVGGSAATVWLCHEGGNGATGAANSAQFDHPWDPADYAIEGYTLKLRVLLRTITDAVAPATTFKGWARNSPTFGGLASAYPTITGTTAVGTAAQNASPAAGGPAGGTTTAGTEFDAPAAGSLILAVENTGAPAATAFTWHHVLLQRRYVPS